MALMTGLKAILRGRIGEAKRQNGWMRKHPTVSNHPGIEGTKMTDHIVALTPKIGPAIAPLQRGNP